ncbi:MAG: DUF4390 domain-containing protein [Burkholderiales bacterium]
MTVSSTPPSTRPEAHITGLLRRGAYALCLPLLCGLALTMPRALAADPATGGAPAAVSSAAPVPQLRREEAGWELSADLDLPLSPTLESALQRGVPLHFTLRLVVTKPRWYWLDDDLVDIRRDYRVSYHALTRQYRVSTGALALSYPGLPEAMRAIASLRSWLVADAARFRPGERYRARLELRLDGSRLPRPFQINLIGPGEWSSDVETEWEFAP